MKNTLLSTGCSLLIAGIAFAQEGATTPTPDIPAANVVESVIPAAAAPGSAEIATTEVQEATPVASAAEVVTESQGIVVTDVAPIEGTSVVDGAALSPTQFNEGLVIGAPITQGQIIQGNQIEMAPVYNQGFVNQGFVQQSVMQPSVMAPSIVQPTPVYNAPVATQFNTPVATQFNAPVVNSDPFAVSGTTTAAPCVNCEQNSRRGTIRSVTTRGLSVFARVRGVFGRRN